MATHQTSSAPATAQPEPDPTLQAVILDSLVSAARESFDADDTDGDFDEEAVRAETFTQWLARRLALDVQAHLQTAGA
jgi:hypothetical protein